MTVMLWLTPPPLPVTVIGYVPGVVLDATVSVMTELPLPGAGMGFTLKEAVTPPGKPVALKDTEELNPLVAVVVMVEVPDAPWATVSEVGEAQI